MVAGGELSIGQIQDRPCVAMKGSLFWVWIINCVVAFSLRIKFSLLLVKTPLPKWADEINQFLLEVLTEVVAERAFYI